MTYKCLHGLALPYLSGRFTSVADIPGRSMLKSNIFDRQQLLLPRTKTATIGPRGFYFAGPHSWNSLPVVLRNNSMSLFTFRKTSKLHFIEINRILSRFTMCAFVVFKHKEVHYKCLYNNNNTYIHHITQMINNVHCYQFVILLFINS